MNNLNKITDRIAKDTEDRISEISGNARQEVEGLRRKYEEESEKVRTETASYAQKESALRHERIMGQARLEAGKYVLGIKQQVLAKLFAKAEDDLASLPETQYVEFLAGMAARSSSDGVGEIIMNEKDRSSVGDRTVRAANDMLASAGKKGGLTLSDDTANIKGGLILRCGRIEVNCSVEALVESVRDELTPELAKLLFE